jgi:outer membrane receptor protein involved in Fe transport
MGKATRITDRSSRRRSIEGRASLGVIALLTLAAMPSNAWAEDQQGAAQQGVTAPTPQAAQNVAPQAGPAESAAQAPDIIVTGSLIQRPNNTSVSPIVSVTSDAVRATGAVAIEDALNQLPSFTPAGNAGTGGQGTGGHATLNLHGLGSNRNLVLLDGRRLPLADIQGDVDINFIPEAIIGSVEAITGGASAVYGSDAMSGVVNFKTLDHFEGVRADAQIGDSFRGDLRKFTGSLTLGAKFAEDRGHVLVSFGYTDRQGLSGSKRSFFQFVTPSSYIGTGTYVPSANNLPDQGVLDSVFAGYGVAGQVPRTLNLGFNDDATLFVQTGAVNYKGPTDNGFAIIGGNVRMPVGQQVIIQNPLNRKSIFSKFDYELTPDVTVYGQLLYVDSDVLTASGGSLTQFGTLTTVPVTNPFVPADLRTILASRPDPDAPFTWNGRYLGVPYKNFDEQYDVAQYLAGARGNLPIPSWTWDFYAGYDTTRHHQGIGNAVLKSRVQTLLDAPDGGDSICAGGFDPFGLANMRSLSAECQDYITKTARSVEKLTQTQVQGVVRGPLFKLPGGDANIAVLADYRRNTYHYDPDSDLAAQNVEAVIASQKAHGKVSVKEVAAQVDLPILADLPFIAEFGIGGAFRYSDYAASGGVSSYEGDVRWRPVQSFLIRGSYQRAVRAPNIGELYSAASGSQVAFGTPPAAVGDPCDVRSVARTGADGAQVRALCLAQGIPGSIIDSYTFPTTATAAVTSGNPSLKPETANTYNIGFSWNSRASAPLLSDLSLSVDYYNIKIKNVISTVPGLTVLSKCYNLDGSNPNYDASNQFCALLQRDSNGQLQIINLPYLNLGGLKTDGIEIQANWGVRLSDIGIGGGSGKIYVNTAIGYTRHFSRQTLPGADFQDFAGTIGNGAYPHWKALTTFGYSSRGGGIGLRWRFQQAMDDITSVTTPSNPAPGTPEYDVFDLFGTLKVNRTIEFRAGITNLFDKKAQLVSSSQNSTDLAVFDPVGRSFYIGARLNF